MAPFCFPGIPFAKLHETCSVDFARRPRSTPAKSRLMPDDAPSPPVRIWEWTQTTLLVLILVWTTLRLGGVLPETQVVTGTLTVMLLGMHLLARAAGKGNTAGFHPAGWWLLPFPAYALCNVVWVSPVPWIGWRDWFGWVQMIVVFWVVLNDIRSRRPRHVVVVTIVILALISVVLACYQRFVQPSWLILGRTQAPQFMGRSSGPFGIPNSLGAYLILVLPAVGAMASRRSAKASERVFFGWLTLVLCVGLWLTISRGAWISLALSLTLWPLFFTRGRVWRRIALAAATLMAVALLAVVVYRTSSKVQERLVQLVQDVGDRPRPILWRAAWKLFREHPAFGSGAGSYNVFFERYRPEHEQCDPESAHNDYLNTLSDYGAVGFVLFFGAALTIAVAAARHAGVSAPASRSEARGFNRFTPGFSLPIPHDPLDEPIVRQAIGIGMLGFALHLMVDFHFKIPALAMTFATVGALLTGLVWPACGNRNGVAGRDRAPWSRLALGVSALAVLAFHAGWLLPRHRAEAIRYRIRSQIDRLDKHPVPVADKRVLAERALSEFTRAIELDPSNAQSWSDRAYAAGLVAHEEPKREVALGVEAEADVRKALQSSPVVAEFWLRLGVALDMQRRWVEAGNAFTQALRLAPASAPAWFYYSYHLSINPITHSLARSAVATCLRLDPGNRDAEALRRHLAGDR